MSDSVIFQATLLARFNPEITRPHARVSKDVPAYPFGDNFLFRFELVVTLLITLES